MGHPRDGASALERLTNVPAEKFPPSWQVGAFRVALAFVLLVTVERVAQGSLSAIVGGDEGSFWAFRAKALYSLGGFGDSYRRLVASRTLHHSDYPLLNSLLQCWCFIEAGHITHVLNRVPVQLVSVALVLVCASAFRRAGGPLIAAGFLLLMPGMVELRRASGVGYSDIMVAAGALLALDGYLRFEEDGKVKWITLSSIGLVFAVVSKHEGTILLFAVLASLLVFSRARRVQAKRVRFLQAARVLIPPIAALGLGWVVNAFAGSVPSHSVGGSIKDGPDLIQHIGGRVGGVLDFVLLRMLEDPRFSQWAFGVFLLLLVLAPHVAWRAPLRIPSLAILLTFAGLMGAIVIVRAELQWQLQTAGARIGFQIVPSVLLWLAWATHRIQWRNGQDCAVGWFSRPLSALLLLLLLVRGGASTWASTRVLMDRGPGTIMNALTFDEDRRLKRALLRKDERGHLVPGEHQALVSAVRAFVPLDGTVFEIARPDNPLRRMLPTVQIITYPRKFVRRVSIPHSTPSPPPNFFVLDLEVGDSLLREHFVVCAFGRGWKLWGGRKRAGGGGSDPLTGDGSREPSPALVPRAPAGPAGESEQVE